MKIRFRFLVGLFILMTVMSSINAYILFDARRTEYMAGIDGKLRTVVSMAEEILPAGYHDRITGKDSVSPDAYRKIVERWNRISVDNGLQYLWSNMVVGDDIVFTTSTSTSKDVTRGDHARFFDVHRDPAAFDAVRESERPTYSSFSNEWGTGRMLLVPRRDAQGRLVMFGASVATDDLNDKIMATALDAMLVFVAVTGLGTVLSFFLSDRITHSLAELAAVARKIADGHYGETVGSLKGGNELLSLADSVNTMSDAIRQHNQNLEEMVAKRTQELARAKAEAERANRAKSDFLSSMSHELRTPLNSILGFAQILKSDDRTPLSDQQREQIRHIEAGGDHLLELINEVLQLAQIEAGKLTLNVQAIDPKPVLDECISLAETLAEKRRIKLVDRTGEKLPVLWVDELRAKQAILNLLSNAVKYNREAGTIWVDARESRENFLRIGITDMGFGISDDDHAEIFQPFNRLGATASGIEGTGIGLVLTKMLVEEMGGTMAFESIVGKGSTFWIDFPIACEREAVVKTDDRAETVIVNDVGARKGQLLLYVEDNSANLALMEDIVEDIPNLDLISAPDAERGIDLAAERKPDVIVLDINLPGMSGIDAVKHLKARNDTRDIPVLALSADAMPASVERGLEAGFNSYLTKPVNVSKLIEALRSALFSG